MSAAAPVFSGVVGCSSANGTEPRGGVDASEDSADAATDAGADSGSLAVHNDPSCPPVYWPPPASDVCSPVGLGCSYPGAGDGNPAATAVYFCVAGDGGSDAGTGHWLAAQ